MFHRSLSILAIFFLYSLVLQGQEDISNNLKIVDITVDGCILVQDQKSILPSSVKCFLENNIQFYGFILDNDKILLDSIWCDSIQNRNIRIEYRVFPFNFKQTVTGLDTTLLEFKDILIGGYYEYAVGSENNKIIESDGLNYRGSFGRGLSVGNSQSLILNSNFDLQMSGDIGNGIKVLAAISDANLPIQAQGNTQQLQEFDRVFIQVSKDRTSLIAGDYELRHGEGYFMQYFKKLKGLSARTQYDINKNVAAETRASFAVSRGKFARQNLQIQEGNQGPYKMQGNNNERFIIVLAGTEKIFFNGFLLKRGFDYDYVIDYNRAEIKFSPTRVVARDSRVIIEFEYTDINYLRTLYEANSTFKGKKWEAYFNIYSEQDSKNQTADAQLDSTDIAILTQGGDDLSAMVRSSIRLIGQEERESSNIILYKAIPNPNDPTRIILQFTENLDSAIYSAVFTEVGTGKGDYEINTLANKNGRVYMYVGQNLGKYAPVIQLIPPEKRQLITAGGKLNINKNTVMRSELAMSNFDVNTRSTINNDNNTGLAGFISVHQNRKLDTLGKWRLNSNLRLEHIYPDFVALNPFRNAEFVRDWNLENNLKPAAENLIIGDVQLVNGQNLSLRYGLSHYARFNQYEGLKQKFDFAFKTKKIDFISTQSYLVSEANLTDRRGVFYRPNIQMTYFLSKNSDWRINTELDAERNIFNGILTDTLDRKSFAYQHYKAYLGNDFEKDFAVKIGVTRRYDQFSDGRQMRQSSIADEIEVGGKWFSKKSNTLSWNLLARELRISEPDLLPNAETNKRTLLGKLDYNFFGFSKAINANFNYNISSGQEPKIEYKFEKIENGRGDFVYVGEDPNPNVGLIQDFRFNPSDPLANYIRLSLFNNEFIRTNNLEWNQSVRVDFDKFFTKVNARLKENEAKDATKFSKQEIKKNKKNAQLRKFISRFGTLSAVRLNKRNNETSGQSLNSFFDFSLQDSSLVAYNGFWNNTLFFNRGNVWFDLQLGNRTNKNRVVQVSGFEDRNKDEYFLKSRIKVGNKSDFIINIETGESGYASQVFGARDFLIDYQLLNPEINFRPTQNTRWITKYNYVKKQQTILGKEKAVNHEFALEYNMRKASLYSLDATISFVNILFTGKPNSTIEYDMLEGLKNGNNYLWNVIYTKRMAKNIDFTINYEGRKPGSNPVIHIGRAQVKATF